jgi:predicted transcriptional regulator
METTKDSKIVPSLLKAAERLKSATWLTTTAAVVTTVLASVASTTFTHERVAYALTAVAALLAALGYGAVYQRERKVELTLGDYLLKSVSASLKKIPSSRKKAALDLLFILAEASGETKVRREFDTHSLALSAGISADEAQDILEDLQRSGLVIYHMTPNKEYVSLSHDLLVDLLLKSRNAIFHDVFFKEAQEGRTRRK